MQDLSSDPAYEAAHAAAEKKFYTFHIQWLESLLSELQFHWPAKPETLRFKLAQDLASACSDFVAAELFAFGESLKRRRAPKSQIAKHFEEYIGVVLDEVYRHKWANSISQHVDGRFGTSDEEHLAGVWNLVKSAAKAARDDLHANLWFSDGTAAAGEPVDVEHDAAAQAIDVFGTAHDREVAIANFQRRNGGLQKKEVAERCGVIYEDLNKWKLHRGAKFAKGQSEKTIRIESTLESAT